MICANCGEEVSALEETIEVSVWRAKMEPSGEILACGPRREEQLVVRRNGEDTMQMILTRGNEAPLKSIREYVLGSTYMLVQFGRDGDVRPYKVRAVTTLSGGDAIRLERV